MPALSRSQIVVYVAVAVALLLVGTRAIRAEGSEETYASTTASSSYEPSGSGGFDDGGGGFSLSGPGGDIVVDVAGAVRHPGVYRLPNGARVVDAVSRAGGPSSGALLEAINRAARLTDGQQILVPKAGPAGATAGTAGASAQDGPISLGGATVEQLDTIDGIGPVTAQKIVEYRDLHGGLASVEQLNDVSGIGPATMQSLRARIQP